MTEVVWQSDWLWSLPLIVFCVVIHVVGLGFINQNVDRIAGAALARHRLTFRFVVAMGTVIVAITALHGIEAAVWAGAYQALGAVPDAQSAMLYSLGALTSYGHAQLFLEPQWQLMGTLEALNGIMLIGLSTAFMFAMIQKLWPSGQPADRRSGA